MTTSEYEEAKERYLNNESLGRLAAWYACTPKTLRRKLVADGVEIRKQHTPPAPLLDVVAARLMKGDDQKQIQANTGCSSITLSRARKKVSE